MRDGDMTSLFPKRPGIHRRQRRPVLASSHPRVHWRGGRGGQDIAGRPGVNRGCRGRKETARNAGLQHRSSICHRADRISGSHCAVTFLGYTGRRPMSRRISGRG